MKGPFSNPNPAFSLSHRTPIRSNLTQQLSANPSNFIWPSSVPHPHLKPQLPNFQSPPSPKPSTNTFNLPESYNKYFKTTKETYRDTPSEQIAVKNNRFSTPVNSKQNSIPKLKFFILHSKTEEKNTLNVKNDFETSESRKKLENPKIFMKFEPDLPKSQTERFIVTKFSLPKILMKSEKNTKHRQQFKNHKVDEFFDRFEKKTEQWPDPVHRIGTNGWKLTRTKK